MSSFSTTITPPTTLAASDIMDPDKVLDLGAYKQVNVIANVLSPGTGGNWLLEQAAENGPGCWIAVSGASVDLTSGGCHFISITAFCRYLRWKCDAAVAGNPVLVAWLVAKD